MKDNTIPAIATMFGVLTLAIAIALPVTAPIFPIVSGAFFGTAILKHMENRKNKKVNSAPETTSKLIEAKLKKNNSKNSINKTVEKSLLKSKKPTKDQRMLFHNTIPKKSKKYENNKEIVIARNN
jgi:hypothetical protein